MNNNLKKYGTDFIIISFGAVIFALSFILFLRPNTIAPGGISGIAIIVNSVTAIPVGTLILVLNIPLFIISYIKFGFKFIFSTLYAVALCSVLIDLPINMPIFTKDALLASVYGGLLLGTGIGLIFLRGATTGGVDILGRFLKLRYPHVRIGRLILVLDFFIVTASAIVSKDVNRALYSIITIYISSLAVDTIIYGTDAAKVAFIISDKNEEIARNITTGLLRGVTLLSGQGGYTNRQKRVIMCAVKSQQMAGLYEIVTKSDPDAFVIVTDAKEVLGDGFTRRGKNSI
jgi:uncharacterized membrane-anchored protein YitT (DUF2179 family)